MANPFMNRQGPVTWLEVARRARGWSKADVHNRIGTCIETYNKIESGKMPYTEAQAFRRAGIEKKLEETFKVPWQVLLSFVPNPTDLAKRKEK